MPCGNASWFPCSINSRNSPKSTENQKAKQISCFFFSFWCWKPTWFNWNSIGRVEIHYEANDENGNKDGTLNGLHDEFWLWKNTQQNKDYCRSLGTNKKWNKPVSFLFNWMHIYNRSVCFSFFFSFSKKKRRRRRKNLEEKSFFSVEGSPANPFRIHSLLSPLCAHALCFVFYFASPPIYVNNNDFDEILITVGES